MKEPLRFETTLTKEAVVRALRENTYATAYDFQSLILGKHYFSGQVGEPKIRIMNSLRDPKNPSCIFNITVT